MRKGVIILCTVRPFSRYPTFCQLPPSGTGDVDEDGSSTNFVTLLIWCCVLKCVQALACRCQHDRLSTRVHDRILHVYMACVAMVWPWCGREYRGPVDRGGTGAGGGGGGTCITSKRNLAPSNVRLGGVTRHVARAGPRSLELFELRALAASLKTAN